MLALDAKKISDNSARMGRPPLGAKAEDTKPLLVRMDAAMRARLKAALRPGEKEAALVRDAIVAELQARERDDSAV